MATETGIFTDDELQHHIHSEELAIKLNQLLIGLPLIDFGCGDGYYIEYIRARYPNRHITGLDGNPPKDAYFKSIQQVDLTSKLFIRPKGNVISLEVGEHIPEEFEQIFLDNITEPCSFQLVLSWAIPGQPGIGHVNCRTNEYIIDQLDRRGFVHLSDISTILRYLANDSTPWFKDTLMYFERK